MDAAFIGDLLDWLFQCQRGPTRSGENGCTYPNVVAVVLVVGFLGALGGYLYYRRKLK